jgi:hypothetical protein
MVITKAFYVPYNKNKFEKGPSKFIELSVVLDNPHLSSREIIIFPNDFGENCNNI